MQLNRDKLFITNHFKLAAIEAKCNDLIRFEEIIAEAKKLKGSIVDSILDEGILNEEIFLETIAKSIGLEWMEVEIDSELSIELKSRCNAAIAIRYQVVPVGYEEGHLVLACYDPFNLGMRQVITRTVSSRISYVMASRRNIRSELSSLYGVGADTFEKILEGRDLDMEGLSDEDEAAIIDDDNSESH